MHPPPNERPALPQVGYRALWNRHRLIQASPYFAPAMDSPEASHHRMSQCLHALNLHFLGLPNRSSNAPTSQLNTPSSETACQSPSWHFEFYPGMIVGTILAVVSSLVAVRNDQKIPCHPSRYEFGTPTKSSPKPSAIRSSVFPALPTRYSLAS